MAATTGPGVLRAQGPGAEHSGQTFPLDSIWYLAEVMGQGLRFILEASGSRGSSLAERAEPRPRLDAGRHWFRVPVGTSPLQPHRWRNKGFGLPEGCWDTF